MKFIKSLIDGDPRYSTGLEEAIQVQLCYSHENVDNQIGIPWKWWGSCEENTIPPTPICEFGIEIIYTKKFLAAKGTLQGLKIPITS